MLEITTKLSSGTRAQPRGQLRLPFELRQKSRLRAQLVSGEAVALTLPRGEILRGGDRVATADGRVIEIVAAPEKLLHVECASPEELARAAYHLGNRHVPVQVGEGFLRLASDHVLEEMLRGLGARISSIEAAFEPEAGAYGGGGHRHGDEAESRGARIHEYGEFRLSSDHDHGHDGHHHHGHRHK